MRRDLREERTRYCGVPILCFSSPLEVTTPLYVKPCDRDSMNMYGNI